jgi:hypothetical protein
MKLPTYAGAVAAAMLSFIPMPASAVDLSVVTLGIFQEGNNGLFRFGHTVIAATNYNRLIAGGTFEASCNNSAVNPLRGARTLSSETYGIGRNRLNVTIPEVLPARRNMPGFDSLLRGQTVECTYYWTGRAVESGFSVGAGGISFITGSGERVEAGTEQFTMSKPSLGDGGWTPCLP